MSIRDVYVLEDSAPFELHSNEEITVDLELKKQSPCYNTLLTGRVSFCNCPIARATVKVLDRCFHPLAHAQTGADGRYRIENELDHGEYLAMASAPGYKTTSTECFQICAYDTTRLNFRLETNDVCSSGIVYGRVLRESGDRPISRAAVSLKKADCLDGQVFTTQTNASGQYIVYNLEPGRYILHAEKAGYSPLAPVELTVAGNHYLKFDLVMEKAHGHDGTISGVITYHKLPIPDTAVFLYSLDSRSTETLVQVQATNADGGYLFSLVEQGIYVVKAKLQDESEYHRQIKV